MYYLFYIIIEQMEVYRKVDKYRTIHNSACDMRANEEIQLKTSLQLFQMWGTCEQVDH